MGLWLGFPPAVPVSILCQESVTAPRAVGPSPGGVVALTKAAAAPPSFFLRGARKRPNLILLPLKHFEVFERHNQLDCLRRFLRFEFPIEIYHESGLRSHYFREYPDLPNLTARGGTAHVSRSVTKHAAMER
jgi:hypothetical protein